MLAPILVGGIARADTLTTAMNTSGHRTKLRRMHAAPLDWAMLALVIPWVLAAWLLPETLLGGGPV